MNIQQKLKIIQKTLGLTQTKLSDRFGVSFPTLNSWLVGKSKPRAKKVELIEDILEVEPFFPLVEDRHKADVSPNPKLAPEASTGKLHKLVP